MAGINYRRDEEGMRHLKVKDAPMTNKEQLRNQFEEDKGVRCITPKGDGDIRYVEFLESEIEKRDNGIDTMRDQLYETIEDQRDLIRTLEEKLNL